MAGALSAPLAAAALVLCVAAVAKLRAPAVAIDALRTLGLPAGRSLVYGAAVGELVLGGSWLAAPSTPGAAALSCVYGAFALLALLLARQRAACGCFGELQTPASGIQAALNAALAAVCAGGALAGAHGVRWMLHGGALSAIVLAAGVTGAAYGLVVAYTQLPRAWAAWSAG